jgi:hypothetical protein
MQFLQLLMSYFSILHMFNDFYVEIVVKRLLWPAESQVSVFFVRTYEPTFKRYCYCKSLKIVSSCTCENISRQIVLLTKV